MATVVDANHTNSGLGTVYTYDNMDRLQTRQDPLLNVEHYS